MKLYHVTLLLCCYYVSCGVIDDNDNTDFIYWAPERYLTFFGDTANSDDITTQNKDNDGAGGAGDSEPVDNSLVIKASEAADLCLYK